LADTAATVRKYFQIAVSASISPTANLLQRKQQVLIESSLSWSPSVTSVFSEPTNDDIYIDQAIARIPNNIGPSQIFDGVYLAASRMITWQSKNPDWKNASKILFLLSDGDENTSERSSSQAIDRANIVSGKNKAPVNCLLFGEVNASDFIIAEGISSKTGGSISVVPLGYSISKVYNLIDGLVSYQGSDFNSGYYQDVVDLGSSEYATSVDVNLSVPTGALVTFQAQFSDDGITYGEWTSLINLGSSGSISLKKQGRYMRYKIGLNGSSDFLSPAFSSVGVNYIKHSTDTIFFQPINLNSDADSYVSDVVITHSAQIPETSSIEYGMVQANISNSGECSSLVVPLVQAGRRNVLLTRQNEEMKTTDRFTYSLVGGSWPKSSSIEVYRFLSGDKKGSLVPSSLYIPNESEGSVHFLTMTPKGSSFVASISMPKILRVVCKITNRSEEIAKIDHVI
jgi:hypothetical protein